METQQTVCWYDEIYNAVYCSRTCAEGESGINQSVSERVETIVKKLYNERVIECACCGEIIWKKN